MTARSARPEIRAGGGVLWRSREAGRVEVALVHRPRYDDWSLPKGKLRRGEHPLVGACREVWEETGLRPRAGARLPTVDYPVRVGRDAVTKVVEYWAMSVRTDQPGPAGPTDRGVSAGDEVDEVSWVSLESAPSQVSYAHDAGVLAAFQRLPRLSCPVVVLRHASAGKRGSWQGPDDERPLDHAGLARVRRLSRVLTCYGPGRLISAPARRCVQSLEPLADDLRQEIGTDVAWAETADPAKAADHILALANSPEPVVICSQRGLIGPALAAATGRPAGSWRLAKGAGWVLSFASGALATVDEVA